MWDFLKLCLCVCEAIFNYNIDNTITILPSITSLPLNFLLQDSLILFWYVVHFVLILSVWVCSGRCATPANQVLTRRSKNHLSCVTFFCRAEYLGPLRWPHLNDDPPRSWRSGVHRCAGARAEADGGRGALDMCRCHFSGKLAEINNRRIGLHTWLCIRLQKTVAQSTAGEWHHRSPC